MILYNKSFTNLAELENFSYLKQNNGKDNPKIQK